ncbi:27911_t:CDS:2, partial [Dentiscutata erythropus]
MSWSQNRYVNIFSTRVWFYLFTFCASFKPDVSPACSGSLNPVFPRLVNPEGTQAEDVLYEALKTLASENNMKAWQLSETRRVESILKEKEDQEAYRIKSNVLDEHIIESNLILERKRQKRKHADKESHKRKQSESNVESN